MSSVFEQKRKLLEGEYGEGARQYGGGRAHLQVAQPDCLHHLLVLTQLACPVNADVHRAVGSPLNDFLEIEGCLLEERTGKPHMAQANDDGFFGCKGLIDGQSSHCQYNNGYYQ